MYKHLDRIEINKEFVVNIPREELPEPRRVELKRYLTAIVKAPPLPPDWDWHWVVKRGKYAGTMPKRIGAYYHKEHNLDLDSKLLEWIGNFSKQNSSPAQDYYFDFADRFLWSDGNYGDSGSCYWGSNRAAKDVLVEHGALSMRFYFPPSKSDWRGRARCWMATDNPNGFVLFNAYDNKVGGRSDKAPPDSHPVGLFTMARVLGTFLGLSYKKIGLSNNGTQTGLVYINSGGYLVGETKDIERFESIDLKWPKPEIACSNCGKKSFTEEMTTLYHNAVLLCSQCLNEKYRRCGFCHSYLPLAFFSEEKPQFCRSCFPVYFAHCGLCHLPARGSEMFKVYDVEELICSRCRDYKTTTCERCETVRHNGKLPCRCLELFPVSRIEEINLAKCHECNIPILGTMHVVNGRNCCHICARVVQAAMEEPKDEAKNEEN